MTKCITVYLLLFDFKLGTKGAKQGDHKGAYAQGAPREEDKRVHNNNLHILCVCRLVGGIGQGCLGEGDGEMETIT